MTLGALLVSQPLPALAVDKFEIQVYEADINEPGQFALELHTNFTPSGHTSPEYSGETPPHQALRLTLEPALGVTEWLELGGYLQGMLTPDGGLQFGGFKLRAKFVVPERLELPVFLGINVEVGRVPLAVERDGWANEFRPFIGWTNGYFLFDVNPIFGYALSGPDKLKPDFEPAFKAAYNTQLGFQLGLEYYAGLGLIGEGFSALDEQEQLLLLAFDLVPPAGEKATASDWELNVGVGPGLTDGTPQHWIVKTIVGKTF